MSNIVDFLRKGGEMEERKNIINTSLRLTEERNNYIKEKANEIGISQNALINVLIDLGIKFYELNLEDVLFHIWKCPSK